MKTLLSYKVIHSEENSKLFSIKVKEISWFRKPKEKTFECFAEKKIGGSKYFFPSILHTGELMIKYSWGISDSVQYLLNTNLNQWTNKDNNNK